MTISFVLLLMSGVASDPVTLVRPLEPVGSITAPDATPVPAPIAPEPTAERAPDVGNPAGAVLSATELDSLRGGQSLVVGNQTLTAITSGNVFNGDYVAGSVSLSDNAFANFNGIGNLAINTGAQVSLQSGMSVVINVEP